MTPSIIPPRPEYMHPLPDFAPWLPDRILERRPAVEESLRAAFDLPADPALPLYRMMRHHLGWVDALGEERPDGDATRLLGILCVEAAAAQTSDAPDWAPEGAAEEAAQAQSEAAERSRDRAAAVELLGASIAVHEDIQTAAQRRNGQDAVWWTWGPAQAINAGDAFHALARLAILRKPGAPDETGHALAALAELDNAALAYYNGQHQDLQMQERVDVTEGQYMTMARTKHGALPGAALALGALVGGADEETAAKWRKAGVAIGAAAAMAKDYREIWGKGEAVNQGRALSKSKLYPVVVGLRHAAPAQRRELASLYVKRVMEPADLERVRAILEEAGVLRRIRDEMDDVIRSAVQALEKTELTLLAIDFWADVFDGMVGEPPR